MPRVAFLRKSLKNVCVDTVLFFATFALVGHLTINFWERYTIQNELKTMKHSLHSLKDTISNIGKAYDTLHSELRDLFIMVDKKHLLTECKEPDARCKTAYNLNHKTLHDLHVQTMISKANKKKVCVGVETDSGNAVELNGHEQKATGPLGKHVTTNTKNPPKSTGTTPDNQTLIDQSNQFTQNPIPLHIHSYRDRLRCYENKENCRHLCQRAKARNL